MHAPTIADSGELEFKRYNERFYALAAQDDVAAYDAATLAAFARLAWDASRKRRSGERIVAAVAPGDAQHGFHIDGSVLVTVNDDMPFLYDSVLSEIQSQGLRVVAAFHPMFLVMRDADGERVRLAEKGEPGSLRESTIFVVVERERDPQRLAELKAGVEKTLTDVAAAVRDWRAMLAKLQESIGELRRHPPAVAKDELDEAIAFLEWLGHDHFTFLGCRDYAFDASGEGRHSPLPESGLGLLADPDARVVRRDSERAALTPDVRGFLTEPSPLIVTKSNVRSTVHRRVHQDYIGIKRFDASGRLIGERRFVGLFTSAAYYQLPHEIPLLRRKTTQVIERAGFPHASHDGKALIAVLEGFPRDELFQFDEEHLYQVALGILHLLERPRTKVFLRNDRFDRFVSALVYLPRNHYSAEVEERIARILERHCDGRIAIATPQFGDTPVARIHYIVRLNVQEQPTIDEAALVADVVQATRTWADGLDDALARSHPDGLARRLYHRYVHAFPASYREAVTPAEAVGDIDRLEALSAKSAESGTVAFHVFRRAGDAHHELRLKLYYVGGVAELSSSMPVFENMGLTVAEELNHRVRAPGETGFGVTIHDYRMRLQRERPLDIDEVQTKLADAMAAAFAGTIENDGFNRLTLDAGLAHGQVTILRAVAKFLRQTGIPFSQAYMEEALDKNPDITALIVKLFETRFDPATAKSIDEREAAAAQIRKRIDQSLTDVKSLDDDRILRRFRNAIGAMLRTNAYQRDKSGAARPALSFKFEAAKLDELPAPRPWAEIFVYSPRVEGVHLRFGRVARGGIRWSDRREDFRTEVLGLVKAQQVKNAVIVPVGAKGGFYPKHLPVNGTREAVQAEGIGAYKTYVEAMLDVTDTITPGGIKAADCVRFDGDDPYLVVAADKGTATFSDIANGIALERGFWLGDAFASGGSAGYDHKKMGITARGAWEAVKRHFREMGRDTQSQDFTVVGVGDMSGDVFGNGMLLSPFIKLVAAFDHRDIFIDPTPDLAASFAERQRLFDLPRSSWADYDKTLISRGGGIFSRSLKAIALTPEIKALTGLNDDTATPAQVMQALLKAEVDLLWFGGIGTYVKASTQSHAQAGDRANDSIRVDGGQIRAKVVGEGANLGCTQAARIEFARHGGRINTDAIDNSAGVDTSDHEVNLKILLNAVVAERRMTLDERNALLAAMTDEVAQLVLKDNYDQTLALSVAQAQAVAHIEEHQRFMRWLEGLGRLDRGVEGLPDDTALRQLRQQGQGLTRPELAVLLAYSKLQLNDALLASTVPDEPAYETELTAYFPTEIRKRFASDIGRHRLRREIVATAISNDVVNRSGPSFVHRMMEASGAGAPEVARAVAIVTGAFRLDELARRIDALDGSVPAELQISMHHDAIALMRRQTLWMLRTLAPDAPMRETIETYRAGIDSFRGTFSTLVSRIEGESIEARIAMLEQAGVPHDLAEDVGVLAPLAATTEIVHLAATSGTPLDAVAGAYFAVGAELGIDTLRTGANRIATQGHWDTLSLQRLADDLYAAQRSIAAKSLRHLDSAPHPTRTDGASAVKRWAEAEAMGIARTRTLIADLERDGALTLSKFALAVTQLRDLAG